MCRWLAESPGRKGARSRAEHYLKLLTMWSVEALSMGGSIHDRCVKMSRRPAGNRPVARQFFNPWELSTDCLTSEGRTIPEACGGGDCDGGEIPLPVCAWLEADRSTGRRIRWAAVPSDIAGAVFSAEGRLGWRSTGNGGWADLRGGWEEGADGALPDRQGGGDVGRSPVGLPGIGDGGICVAGRAPGLRQRRKIGTTEGRRLRGGTAPAEWVGFRGP